MINRRDSDEMRNIFINNELIGYVDEIDNLYGINGKGYAVYICIVDDYTDERIMKALNAWKSSVTITS